MWLPPRKTYLQDSRLTPGGVLLLGQSIRLNIDRTWPLEEIWVGVSFTNDSTAPTITNLVDGLFNFLKRVTLEVNDGVQPRKVVDFSGPGLVEYALGTGGFIDNETRYVKLAAVNSATHRIWYRIPLVHPAIYGPLRTQMLLPVHNHPQDPVLTLEFCAAATAYSANAPTAIACEVVLCRRAMTKQVNDAVLGNGGFIPFDLVESSMTFPLTAAEFRFPVPTPGQYANLLMRHYLGGTNVTRADVGATTLSAEGVWRLESGGMVLHQWKNHQLQAINESSSIHNIKSATASSNFAGQFMLDFLTDGIVDADELGSLLDCNLPAASGLKMEVIGTTATVATNASRLVIGGHRYFGDLSRWQAKK